MKSPRTHILRAAAVALTAALLLLPGCGLNRMPDKQTLTHVYRATEVPMPSENSYIDKFEVRDGKIFFSTGYWDENTNESVTQTFEVNLDGTGFTETTPPKEDPPADNTDDTAPAVTPNYYEIGRETLPDGSAWVAECHYSYDETTYEYSEEYIFLHTAADGSEISRFTGEALWGTPEEGMYYGVNRFSVADSGELLITGSRDMYIVSSEGRDVRTVDLSAYTENGYVQQYFSRPDGVDLLFYDWSGNRGAYFILPLSLGTGTLGEAIPLDGELFENAYSFFEGDGSYSFYFMTEDAVYGYDLASAAETELLNFLNSDLNYSVAYNMHIVSPEKFVTYGYDSLTQSQAIYILDRVPEEQLVPKYIITLGMIEDNYAVRNEVIRFNRQSDEYRITLKTYELNYDAASGEEYDYAALMEEAVTALNNDMLAGTGPDILLTNTYMPIDSYISKGLFVDLYKYIDGDADLSREDFLPNVLSALEVNGGLYEVIPAFTVRTLVGKTEMLGGRTSWTMEEFTQFTGSLPEGTSVFFELTRGTVMDMFLAYTYEEFIDAETGKCTFDSAAFGQMLTFLKSLPEELDEERMKDPDYWQMYENRYRENKAVLEQVYLSGFRNLMSMMNYTFFTDELTMIGVPTSGASGGAIAAGDMSFAISTKSRLKDASWEFVRYFLTEEYQDGLNFYFPLRAESLDAMMETAIAEAEEEKKWQEENSGGDYIIDDDMVVETMPAVEKSVAVMPGYGSTQYYLTREMAEEIRDYVKSVNRVIRQNASVTNIIKEDAGAFFAGQKSLEDTVRLIQDRVGTVVAEGR